MHSFDPEIAKRVGVNAAVLYQNILFWTEKNAANGNHIHDGCVWTYNSLRAWSDLFPYLTVSQIRTALDKLVSGGLVQEGCYNKSSMDRTKWYGVKSQVHSAKITNAAAENHAAIPDINTNINTDSNKELSFLSSQQAPTDVEIAFDAFRDAANDCGWPVPQVLSDTRKAAISKRLKAAAWGGLDGWRAAIDKARSSSFLRGERTGSTPMTIDWLSKPANLTKILEGNYDDKPASQNIGHDDSANGFPVGSGAKGGRSRTIGRSGDQIRQTIADGIRIREAPSDGFY